MTTIDNAYLVKTSNIFTCNICNYSTCRKYNLELHNDSIKHKTNILATNDDNNLVKVSKNYSCENCNKNFGDRSGLWRHKKKCNSHCDVLSSEKIDDTKMVCDKELIMTLIKQNAELLEIIKNGTNNNSHNNNNNTNSLNKTFNLQFFLNETCKDAMNISEFIENISLQLSDLESIGKLGYVEGVSNIIIKNLNALEVTQRPLHCTDKKRETVYVKDEDEWQKEEENKKRIKQVISNVVSKNMKLLPEYQNKYPECMNPESKKSDEYNKIIMETMGGGMDVVDKNKDKIIKKVTKSVIVEKEE
jgi:hypothetical protein